MANNGKGKGNNKKKSTKSFLNKVDSALTQSGDLNYNMYKKIKNSPLNKMKTSFEDKDEKVRDYLTDSVKNRNNKGQIYPGMMLMFKYNHPKTKDKLEYYDAAPCTIFFGIVNTKEGKRVLGFNLHYYPPVLRQQILSWMFDQFKAFFIQDWDSRKPQRLDQFKYNFIVNELKKIDLDFGVRMYIPELMASLKKIPPKYFEVAVFTEGHFKKETREQILKYWKTRTNKLF